MIRISRSLTTPALLIIALMLSSCVGAAVQSMLLPQSRSAAYAGESTFSSPADALYAQGTATLTTTSNTDQPIAGMTLSLPTATTTAHHALVTFNAPSTNPRNTCVFTVYIGTTATSGIGATTSTDGDGIPMNIVIRLPLTAAKQTVRAEWREGGGTCQIFAFYSLSAIITN